MVNLGRTAMRLLEGSGSIGVERRWRSSKYTVEVRLALAAKAKAKAKAHARLVLPSSYVLFGYGVPGSIWEIRNIRGR